MAQPLNGITPMENAFEKWKNLKISCWPRVFKRKRIFDFFICGIFSVRHTDRKLSFPQLIFLSEVLTPKKSFPFWLLLLNYQTPSACFFISFFFFFVFGESCLLRLPPEKEVADCDTTSAWEWEPAAVPQLRLQSGNSFPGSLELSSRGLSGAPIVETLILPNTACCLF